MGLSVRATLTTTFGRAASLVTGRGHNGVEVNLHKQTLHGNDRIVSNKLEQTVGQRKGLYERTTGRLTRFRSSSADVVAPQFNDIPVTLDRIPQAALKDLRDGLYQQVLQPTFPDSVSEPSPEVVKHVARLLTQDPELTTLYIDHINADGIYNALIESAQGKPFQAEIESLVLRTKHGEDTWLRRLADSFVAINVIRNQNTLTSDKGKPAFNIGTDYLLFYYSLMGGILESSALGENGTVLEAFFQRHLDYVDLLFEITTKTQPPKLDPKIFSQLPEEDRPESLADLLMYLPRKWLIPILVPKKKAHKEALPLTPTGIDISSPFKNSALHRMTEPREWTDASVLRAPELDQDDQKIIETATLELKERLRLSTINDPHGIMSRFIFKGMAQLWISSKAYAGVESEYSHAKLVTILMSFMYECVQAGKGIVNAEDVEAANEALMMSSRRILMSADSYIYKSEASIEREIEVILKAAIQGRPISKGMSHIGIGDTPKATAEDGASRVVAKRSMATAPFLRNIFGPARKTLVDRPEDRAATFRTFYDQAIASSVPLFQRLYGLENRKANEKELDFSSGTRSKKGGQAPLRDGSAKLIARLFVPGFKRSDIPFRVVSSSVGVDMAVPSTFADVLRGAQIEGAVIPDRTSYFDPIKLYERYIKENLDGRHPKTGKEWEDLQAAMEREIKATEYQMLIRLMIEAVGDLRFAKEENHMDPAKQKTAVSMYGKYIARYDEAFYLLQYGAKVPQDKVDGSKRYVLAGFDGNVNLKLVEWCRKYKVGYAYVVQLYHFVQTSRADHQRWDGLGEPPLVPMPANPDTNDIDPLLKEMEKAHGESDVKELADPKNLHINLKVLERVKAQAADKPVARKALDRFLDRFHEPIMHQYANRLGEKINLPNVYERDQWLEANGIKLDDFLKLAEWVIKNGELKGIKKRHRSSFSEKLYAKLNLVLPDTMYTREEQLLYGSIYLVEAVRAMRRTLPFVFGEMAEKGMLDIGPDDSRFIQSGKTLARAFAQLERNGDKKSARLNPEELDQLIPEDQLLEPIERDTIIQVLESYAARESVTEVPTVLKNRIQEAFGHDPRVLEAYMQYTLDYLNYITESTGRFLDVYKKQELADSSAEQAAYADWIQELEQSTWKGEPIADEVYWSLMNYRDASYLLKSHGDAQAEFDALLAAERTLEALISRVRQDDETAEDFDLKIAKARRQVSVAFRDYSRKAGLAASDDTFVQLHFNGRTLQPHHLKHILARPEFAGLTGRTELLEAHQHLHSKIELGAEDQSKSLKRQEAAVSKESKLREERFQSIMRGFLDHAGHTRLLQSALIEINSAFEALSKNPTTLLWEVFGRAKQDQVLTMEEQAYQDAMIRYQESGNEKNLGVVERAASRLLASESSLRLFDEANDFLKNSQDQMELGKSFEAYAKFWQERRKKAEEQKQIADEIRREKMEFWIWLNETMHGFLKHEAELTYDAAESLMEKVHAKTKDNPALASRVENFEAIFVNAMDSKELLSEEFQRQRFRQSKHLRSLKKGELNRMTESLGQQVDLNRANEGATNLSIQAYRAAARAWNVVSGHPMPRIISFMRTAMADKGRPKFGIAQQQTDAHNLFNFMGDKILPVLVEAIWTIQQGLPVASLDPAIYKWAQDLSTDFHLVEVDDQRLYNDYPGAVHLNDSTHNGGWYFDYNANVFISPQRGRDGKRKRYILVAKPGLKLPFFMDPGLRVLGHSFPKSGNQRIMDAFLVTAMLYGGYFESPWGDMAFLGSQSYTEFGGLTILTWNMGDINALDEPNLLLSDRVVTGFDGRGIGRSARSVLGAAAVRGTMSGINVDITSFDGVHGTGIPPHGHFRIQPRKGIAMVRSIDPVSWGMGEDIVGEDRERTLYHRWQVAETDIAFAKYAMGVESSVRRVLMSKAEREEEPTGHAPRQRRSVRRFVKRGARRVANRLLG